MAADYSNTSGGAGRKTRLEEDNEILECAVKHVEDWYAYFATNIAKFREDKYFTYVSQWTAQERRRRKIKSKQTLEFNKIATHVMQILGDQRQNTPDAKVRANFKDVDQKIVDLRAGLMRTISRDSDAAIKYQTAFNNQLTGGYGALKVYVDYEHDDSFDMKIFIDGVDDPTLCGWDANAREHDKSDGDYCFSQTSIDRDVFEKRYPKIKCPLSFPVYSNNQTWNGWGNQDRITIVDYYRKEYFKETIVKLSDGRILTKKEADIEIAKFQMQVSENSELEQQLTLGYIQPLVEVDKRTRQSYKIMHYKMIYDQIIDRTEWPCKLLPLVFVDGNSQVVNGMQVTRSFINFAKDVQRQYNYVASEITDALVHSHRSQWMASNEHIQSEQQQAIWRNPEDHSVLLANKDSYGQFPEKVQGFSLSPTLFQILNTSDSDITNILGRYQANLGAPSNEISGTAIAARAAQGNASTVVYFDNLTRAVQSVMDIVSALIPRVYDATRDVEIEDKSGERKIVTINNPQPYGQIENKIDDRAYSVDVTTGPSAQTQKSIAYGQSIDFARLDPQGPGKYMDLIAQNLDLENTNQFVERAKTSVPPQILAEESGQPMPPPQPNPQAIMAQQEMQLKEREMQIKEEQIRQSQVKLQLEQEKILVDRQANLLKAGIDNKQANTELQKAMLDADVEHKKMLKDLVVDKMGL